jgi:hypothetical protein
VLVIKGPKAFSLRDWAFTTTHFWGEKVEGFDLLFSFSLSFEDFFFFNLYFNYSHIFIHLFFDFERLFFSQINFFFFRELESSNI